MWLVAEIASKILRRVWSAKAFDIFSTSERSMVNLECSEVIGLVARENPVPAQIPEKLQPITLMIIQVSNSSRAGSGGMDAPEGARQENSVRIGRLTWRGSKEKLR